MTPLIDADVLCHELGWSGEFKDKESREVVLLDWDHVSELLDKKIAGICEDVGATEDPILFLSSSEKISEMWNQRYKYLYAGSHNHAPNFRYEIGVTKPYKGTRKNPKPFHFYNIVSHMLTHYDTRVSCCGNEADDEMGIYQTRDWVESENNTIICSRDKDLRMIPGWHFSWECGKQRAVGPVHTNELGGLEKTSQGKTIGYGLKFFFYQMLVGDPVDNIPGLPKMGDAKSYSVIDLCKSESELFYTVQNLYKDVIGGKAKEYFQEQKALLWIKRADRMEYKFNG